MCNKIEHFTRDFQTDNLEPNVACFGAGSSEVNARSES